MSEPAAPASRPARSRGLLSACLVLALLGVGLSIELTRIHFLTHTDPGYASICAISERINCNTVALSPFSVLAGLPVSLWGLFGYLLMAILSGWGLARRAAPGWPIGLLFSTFVLAALFSSTLGAISLLEIDSICLFCLGTYLVNGLLLVLGVVLLARQRLSPAAAVVADLRLMAARPWLSAGLGLVALTVVATAELAVPAYWRHLPWAELPRLPEGVDQDGHHWIGAERPLVTIVEFSDYECPYCRSAHKALRELLGRYRDTVRLVHRHFPLDQGCNPAIKKVIHRDACRLAFAVECAGEQGRFWEMGDAVFGTQDFTPAGQVDVGRLATELGLDHARFTACLTSAGPRARIGADAAAGHALDIKGTPTFYVGQRPFLGQVPEAYLRDLVNAARGVETLP